MAAILLMSDPPKPSLGPLSKSETKNISAKPTILAIALRIRISRVVLLFILAKTKAP